VPHGEGLPVLEPPDNFAMFSDDDDSVSSNSQEQQPSLFIISSVWIIYVCYIEIRGLIFLAAVI
jgi:hypothetical protein